MDGADAPANASSDGITEVQQRLPGSTLAINPPKPAAFEEALVPKAVMFIASVALNPNPSSTATKAKPGVRYRRAMSENPPTDGDGSMTR